MADLGGVRRLAWVLGILAALAVAGTSAAAVVEGRGSGILTVRAGGESVSMPADGWRTEPRSVGYVDASGHPLVGIAGGAVYDVGWCSADRSYNHAIVGFVPRSGRTVGAIARDWGAAITLDNSTGKQVGPVRLIPTGSDRVDADLTSPPGACNPPRVHLTVVRAGSLALVLVRDRDLDGVLGERSAERILDSLASSG